MKIITEDDFDKECTDGTIELKILVDKKQKAEILRNQENGEKWIWATDGTGYKEFTKYRLAYERLTKQIEELAEGSYLKTELQKILGEK